MKRFFMPPTSMGTLKKIAEETKYSVSTVSRALNDRSEVSAKARTKIMAVAEELGYRPNLLIRGFQTGRTRTVGVMVPPYNSYWSLILRGVHDELVSEDYAPLTLWYDEDSVKRYSSSFMLKQIHRLLDRRVDGVILWPTVTEAYSEHLEELEARDLPVVTIDHELAFADSVDTDERPGARVTAQHLYNLGHRRFGHLAGDQRWGWAKQRKQYFENAVKVFPDASVVSIETVYKEDIPEAARELLAMKNRPTAIFACSDTRAYMIYKVARDMGIRVPQDLSVVGFSDSHEYNQLIQPPLTTIRQKPEKIGRRAARILIDRLEGRLKGDIPKRVKMECELIVRGSTAAAPDSV